MQSPAGGGAAAAPTRGDVVGVRRGPWVRRVRWCLRTRPTAVAFALLVFPALTLDAILGRGNTPSRKIPEPSQRGQARKSEFTADISSSAHVNDSVLLARLFWET